MYSTVTSKFARIESTKDAFNGFSDKPMNKQEAAWLKEWAPEAVALRKKKPEPTENEGKEDKSDDE